MPNPNNNNENRLSEVKKTLGSYEDMLNSLQFSDERLNELHVNFRNALHALSTETDRYYETNADGNYPVMDAQAFAQFEALYRNAYSAASAMETGLQQANLQKLSESDRAWRSVYGNMMDMVREVLGRDLQHLHSVQRRGNETLPSLIEQSRTHVYNVDGQEMEHVGEGLSSRIAITIPGENGDVRGFFTESISTNREGEIERIRRETLEKHPELAEVLAITQLQNHTIVFSLNRIESNRMVGRNDVLQEWLEQVIPDRAVRKCLAEDGAMLSAFVSFIEQYEALDRKYDTYDANELGENDRIDQRNCAMSAIADLMGMQDLLAHAEPVQITFTKDGREQTLTGSFMHFAEGEDVTRQTPGQGLLNVDAPVDGDTASVKKQLADLQVLDYICGNVDRHNANLFYQLDESDPQHPRVVGIQGIDNDASFTTYTKPADFARMPAPTHMQAIRSQTAAVVEGLDRDILKTMLRNYNLTEAQLDAVWTRTQNLQNAIRDGREFYRDKPEDVFKADHLRVMDDDAFERVSLERLKNTSYDTYFKRLDGITDAALHRYVDKLMGESQKQCLDSMAVFNDQLRKIDDLKQELKDADSAFRRRKEYSEVKRTVKVLSELPALDMREITPDVVRERLPQLQDALKAADAYLLHKREEFEKEKAAVDRKFNEGRINERTMLKDMNKILEKYNGQSSPDAKRIRAVENLKETLSKCLEAGETTQREAAEYIRLKEANMEETLQEVRRRSPQQQAPENREAVQENPQNAPEIQQPAPENRNRSGRRLSAADLKAQLVGQEPDKGRKSVPHKATQQKEVKRSNSMG